MLKSPGPGRAVHLIAIPPKENKAVKIQMLLSCLSLEGQEEMDKERQGVIRKIEAQLGLPGCL